MAGWPQPVTPGPGQESVWGYPRPPVVEASTELVEVEFGGVLICSTRKAFRVLETSHPPTYYLPVDAMLAGVLSPGASAASVCEWKGVASYLTFRLGDCVEHDVAWTYPKPTGRFAALVGYLALYPGRMDQCRVDGEIVQPQEGGFYGGWITSRIVGPFKGAPGTWAW